jgi:hypothetical protein
MWKKKLGLDGYSYDSTAEATIADWLMSIGVNYEPHKRLPPPSRQVCDWFLPGLGRGRQGIYVEYDGLMEVRTDDKLTRKIRFYEDHGLDYLVITRDHWQARLYEAILA